MGMQWGGQETRRKAALDVEMGVESGWPPPGKVHRWWETYAWCCRDGTFACDGLIRGNVHETGVREGRERTEREPEVGSGRIPEQKEVEETAGAPEMGLSEAQGGGCLPLCCPQGGESGLSSH